MGKFLALLEVLYQGKALASSTVWKNRQVLVNSLIGVLAASTTLAHSFGVRIEVSGDDVAQIAGAVGAIVGLFNAYVTTATSTKVGMPPPEPDPSSPFPDDRLES